LIVFDPSLDVRRGAGQDRRMPSWSAFEAAAPALAAEVRRRLDAHVHKTLATIRADGRPRISGTETELSGGELWLGSMAGARKAQDLRRDPRFALHSGSDDPPGWDGDAKLAGRAEGVPAPGSGHRFRLELEEVSALRLDPARDGLVIEVWTATGGLKRMERA